MSPLTPLSLYQIGSTPDSDLNQNTIKVGHNAFLTIKEHIISVRKLKALFKVKWKWINGTLLYRFQLSRTTSFFTQLQMSLIFWYQLNSM